MPTLLLPVTPLFGHVGPMVSVGRAMAERGHRVTLLTGPAFEPLAAAAGLGFRALPADADVGADVGAGPAAYRRPRLRPRVLTGRDDILRTFVRPLAAQARSLDEAVEALAPDAVLGDAAYLGALPLALGSPPADRPPVLGVSMTPLSVNSDDVAPFGSALQPGDTERDRKRNRNIRWMLQHGPLRRLQQEVDAALGAFGVPDGTVDYFDHAVFFDTTFHLGASEFEYPRRDLPTSVRFVGPLPPPSSVAEPPAWWPDLDGGDPVVHVTQGTMDNGDLGKLLAPTVEAFARRPVLVVVSTGGRPAAELEAALGGRRPNVRVAEFLPYEQLLPKVDVVVTNGGYGGVQSCLRHGVPLVVAGNTEEKPEVAARVRWAGVGVDLRTGTPSPLQVRQGVETVLGDDAYRQNAARMSRAIRELGDPRDTIATELEHRLAQRSRAL